MTIHLIVAIVAAATKVMMIAVASQLVSASGLHGIYNNVSSNSFITFLITVWTQKQHQFLVVALAVIAKENDN